MRFEGAMMTTITIQGHDFEVALPALTGSEKQIAWATDIRRQTIISYVDGKFTLDTPAKVEMVRAGLAKMMADLAKITAAKAWIEASAAAEHHITAGRAAIVVKTVLGRSGLAKP